MRLIKRLIDNSAHLLMFTINLILYGIVFLIYKKCMNTINVTDINADNVWTTFFNHPGESMGVFVSALFLNVFIIWLILIAIVSVVHIITNNHDSSELVMSVLNCILAVVAIILNVLFVKIYWAILIVLLVVVGIIYLFDNSN